DQPAVEEDVELTKPAFLDRHLSPEALFQLVCQLFGAAVIAARPAKQDPEFHVETVRPELVSRQVTPIERRAASHWPALVRPMRFATSGAAALIGRAGTLRPDRGMQL